jgi:hypothetical protein
VKYQFQYNEVITIRSEIERRLLEYVKNQSYLSSPLFVRYTIILL